MELSFFAFFIKISQVVILGISIAYLIILFFKVYAQHWGNCIFLLNLFQYHMNITAYLIIAYMFINLKSKGNKTYEKSCLNLYSVVDTLFHLSITVVRTVEILTSPGAGKRYQMKVQLTKFQRILLVFFNKKKSNKYLAFMSFQDYFLIQCLYAGVHSSPAPSETHVQSCIRLMNVGQLADFFSFS